MDPVVVKVSESEIALSKDKSLEDVCGSELKPYLTLQLGSAYAYLAVSFRLFFIFLCECLHVFNCFCATPPPPQASNSILI